MNALTDFKDVLVESSLTHRFVDVNGIRLHIAEQGQGPLVVPDGLGLLDTMPESPDLPAWLTEEDIQAYAEDFALHGEHAFTGAFNWYRNIERNNELLAPFRGRGIDVPALYVVGDRDMVTSLRGPDGGPSLSALLRGEGGSGNPLSAIAPQP